MRLSPLDPEMFRILTGVALAHLIARRFEPAAAWAAKGFREAPPLVLPGVVLAATHTLGGRPEEAAGVMARVRKLHPRLSRASLEEWLQFRRSEDAALFAEAVERAGLEE